MSLTTRQKYTIFEWTSQLWWIYHNIKWIIAVSGRENKTSWQLWLILINKVDFIIEACCYLYFCHFVVHCIIAHNIALFLLPIIAIKHRSSLLPAFYIKSSAALLSFFLSNQTAHAQMPRLCYHNYQWRFSALCCVVCRGAVQPGSVL